MKTDWTSEIMKFLHERLDVLSDDACRDHTKFHLLDTVAAIVSGSALPAGVAAKEWVSQRPVFGRSSVVGDPQRRLHEDAAFCNAMSAHANESDDSHEPSRSHPGASIVPTTLALSEHLDAGSNATLDAIALGYEACALMNSLSWQTREQRRRAHRNPHAVGGLWGSVVAAAVLYELNDAKFRSVLAYASQMVSGIGTWLRDEAHIEKAFVFSGMPAWHAVRAADLVNSGWPGVKDSFDGSVSYFSAFDSTPEFDVLDDFRSSKPVIQETNIKKYCVGSPAQAAVQAAEELVQEVPSLDDITAVRCHLPADLARIVDGRRMLNINVQYLVARTLRDKRLTFDAAHDESGDQIPEVAQLIDVIQLIPDAVMEPKRQCRLEIELKGGEIVTTTVFPVRGTTENPMTSLEIEDKFRDLTVRHLGSASSEELISVISNFESRSITDLSEILQTVGRVD